MMWIVTAALAILAGGDISIDTTRQTTYDYACVDGQGNVLSAHQRQDKAISACATRAANDPTGVASVC